MKEKERRRVKWTGYFLCFFLVAGTASCYGETEVAEDDVTEEEVVAGTLEEENFVPPLNATHYKTWDADGDGFLGEEEFTTGFYQTWDLNKDGRISMYEWNRVVADYGNGVDAAEWRPWDTDGDGFIEQAEFYADFAQIGWYATWDSDGDSLITEREFTTGVYSLKDTNADDVMDKTEFEH